MNRFPVASGSASACILACLLAPPFSTAQDDAKAPPQLPDELRGAKVYKLPEEGEKGAPPENPVIYRKLAYKDLNLQRLVLNLWVSLKPFDKAVTIRRIYFQYVRANGIPLRVEPMRS